MLYKFNGYFLIFAKLITIDFIINKIFQAYIDTININ